MPEEYFDDEVNEDTVGSGGSFTLVAPGYYFGQVTEVHDGDESFFVELEILSGTKPDQVGQTHREYIHKNAKKGNRSRRAALLVATGVWTADLIAAARKENRGLNYEVDDLYGKVCCFEVVNEEQEQGKYKGKQVAKVPYSNFWHPENKEVARLKIPVDRSKVKDLDAVDDPYATPDTNDDGGFF